MNINKLANDVYSLAVEKGWHEDLDSPQKTVVQIALIMSECAEAIECVRSPPTKTAGKPEGLDIELADVIIRTLDLAASLGLNMEDAITVKHEYNKTRPYKHGGKSL